jgi:hypothetical protein
MHEIGSVARSRRETARKRFPPSMINEIRQRVESCRRTFDVQVSENRDDPAQSFRDFSPNTTAGPLTPSLSPLGARAMSGSRGPAVREEAHSLFDRAGFDCRRRAPKLSAHSLESGVTSLPERPPPVSGRGQVMRCPRYPAALWPRQTAGSSKVLRLKTCRPRPGSSSAPE